MKTLKRIFLPVLFVCFFVGLLNAESVRRKNFTVEYNDRDHKVAEYVAARAEIYQNEIRQKLSLDMSPFSIVISSDEKAFREHSGDDFPHWGMAAAQYQGRKILLKSPRFSRQSFPELASTLYHEMVHLALEPIVRSGYFPRWLNEGLAQFEAEQFDWKKKVLLGQAALYGKFIDLHKIDDVMKFERNRAQLAYAQSVSAVYYLISEYGYHSIGRLLILMHEGLDWNEAFEIVYGYAPEHYSTNWQLWAKKQYRAYALVDIHYLLWIIFPLLVLIAWIRVKRKNRLIFQKWMIEDSIEQNDMPAS